MKKILTIIILSLFFMLPSHADNIRDFQIEGISIGDSLLDHFTSEEIKTAESFYSKSKLPIFKEYTTALIYKNFKNFDAMEISYKKKDSRKTILSIVAGKNAKNKSELNEFYNQLLLDLKNYFKDAQVVVDNPTNPLVKKAKTERSNFKLNANDKYFSVSVVKVDFNGKDTRIKHNGSFYNDNASIIINTDEWYDALVRLMY